MSVSRLLVPVTALAVAAAPAVMPAPAAAPTPPLVHVEAVQLAGIGQNIYNAITPVVQYAVGGVSYLINFIPLAGGIVAAQINIDYFQGIQPAIAATVDYAAALLHAPRDFFPITRAYVDTLVGIQYDLVSAQLRFLGFNELPPRPAAAQAPGPRAASAAAPGDVQAVEADGPAVAVQSARTPRQTRARNGAKVLDRAPVRPAATAKSTVAGRNEPSTQDRGSVETRRQKSTTGRTRSAI